MRDWPVCLKALAAWPIVFIAWGDSSERSQSKNTMYEVACGGGGGGGAWTACGSLHAPTSRAAPTSSIDGLSMGPSPNESPMWRSENARPNQKDATRGCAATDFLAGQDPAHRRCNLIDRFQRHVRAHRQAEHGFRQGLGQGISALHLSEIGISGLQMRRNRIVN